MASVCPWWAGRLGGRATKRGAARSGLGGGASHAHRNPVPRVFRGGAPAVGWGGGEGRGSPLRAGSHPGLGHVLAASPRAAAGPKGHASCRRRPSLMRRVAASPTSHALGDVLFSYVTQPTPPRRARCGSWRPSVFSCSAANCWCHCHLNDTRRSPPLPSPRSGYANTGRLQVALSRHMRCGSRGDAQGPAHLSLWQPRSRLSLTVPRL